MLSYNVNDRLLWILESVILTLYILFVCCFTFSFGCYDQKRLFCLSLSLDAPLLYLCFWTVHSVETYTVAVGQLKQKVSSLKSLRESVFEKIVVCCETTPIYNQPFLSLQSLWLCSLWAVILEKSLALQFSNLLKRFQQTSNAFQAYSWIRQLCYYSAGSKMSFKCSFILVWPCVWSFVTAYVLERREQARDTHSGAFINVCLHILPHLISIVGLMMIQYVYFMCILVTS